MDGEQDLPSSCVRSPPSQLSGNSINGMFPSIAFPSGELTSPWLLSSGGSSIGGSGGTSRNVSVLSLFRDMVAKQFNTIVAIYRSNSFSPLQIKIMRTFGVDLVKDCSGLRSFMNISFVQEGDKKTSIFN